MNLKKGTPAFGLLLGGVLVALGALMMIIGPFSLFSALDSSTPVIVVSWAKPKGFLWWRMKASVVSSS